MQGGPRAHGPSITCCTFETSAASLPAIGLGHKIVNRWPWRFSSVYSWEFSLVQQAQSRRSVVTVYMPVVA